MLCSAYGQIALISKPEGRPLYRPWITEALQETYMSTLQYGLLTGCARWSFYASAKFNTQDLRRLKISHRGFRTGHNHCLVRDSHAQGQQRKWKFRGGAFPFGPMQMVLNVAITL